MNNTNLLKINFKTLKYHTGPIYYLSKLKDGRLISCSYDKLLNIYHKDTFELQISIKENLRGIISFTQLNNGKLITSSSDETMKIIKLIGEDKYEIEQILQGHKNSVMKVIEIRENELISISTDKSMKIWILNKEKKFECITTIKYKYKYSFSNILKLNEKEFVTSSLSEGLKFWNSNNYSNIASISNIEIYWTLKTMCLLNDNILCVGGDNLKGFYLIEISNHKIIKNILGPERIFCIDKCLDGLFLCSIFDENGNDCIVKYKYVDNNLEKIVEKKNAHDTWIWSCVELNNGIIASGGRDNLIKLWSN